MSKSNDRKKMYEELMIGLSSQTVKNTKKMQPERQYEVSQNGELKEEHQEKAQKYEPEYSEIPQKNCTQRENETGYVDLNKEGLEKQSLSDHDIEQNVAFLKKKSGQTLKSNHESFLGNEDCVQSLQTKQVMDSFGAHSISSEVKSQPVDDKEWLDTLEEKSQIEQLVPDMQSDLSFEQEQLDSERISLQIRKSDENLYKDLSPQEVLNQLRDQMFPMQEVPVEETQPKDAKKETYSSENQAFTEMSLTLDDEPGFIPRNATKRKGKKLYTKRNQKPFTSLVFILSVIFGMIIIIVLCAGIYYLSTKDQSKKNEDLAVESVQRADDSQKNQIKNLESGRQSNFGSTKSSTDDTTNQTIQIDGTEFELITHVVKQNEDLSKISQQYFGNDLGIELIFKWNELKSEALQEAQILEIPIPK